MPDLYIPEKIVVGFQKRNDTFTGKLAFITYRDSKGVLRQEKAWNNWRHDTIEIVEFDNTPQNGFIFNKGVQRSGYWGSGRSVIRVYDARDFEFEISVDNLIGILMHSDVSRRDIVEQCIFAWADKSLVLLPVNSEEYQQSLAYTQKQHEDVRPEELVAGYTYSMKKSNTVLTYMGEHDWWDFSQSYSSNTHKHVKKGKKHIFFDGKNYKPVNIEALSAVVQETVAENYPALMDSFFNTEHSQPVIDFRIRTENIDMLRTRYLYAFDNDRLIQTDAYNYYNSFQQTIYHRKKKAASLAFDCERHVYNHELQAKWENHAKEHNLSVKNPPEQSYTQFLVSLGYGELDAVLKNGHTFPMTLW